MENITNKPVPDAKIKIITSKNSPKKKKKMMKKIITINTNL